MKRPAHLGLVAALLLATSAYAIILWDDGPGHLPLREMPRLWVKDLRPHPQSGRSVAPTTAPTTPTAARPFTLSLDLDGLHVGPPDDGPAMGLTWDGALHPWARLH